jgi:DNA-binding MarR family transcriptional regulator
MGEVAKLQRSVHLIGRYLEARLGDLALTQAEAHVLSLLGRGEAAPTIAQIHHELALKRSTLTNVVDRLEQRGLVRREINGDDRRSFLVRPTAKGRRTARQVAATFEQLEAALRRQTSAGARKGLAETLDAFDSIVAARIRPRQ